MSEENQEFHRKTFVLDTVRAVPAGVVETLGTTFTILLANRVFQAGDMAKASLVAMPSLGFVVKFVCGARGAAERDVSECDAWP